MELRHLRYFVAVAEEGGFVRAARRLRVAQPALSRQVRDLEREVGFELIDRDPRATRLTPGGEAALREAHAIFDDVNRAVERARQARHGLAGPCTVCGGKLPVWNGMIARLAETIHRDYPMVDLGLSEGVTRAQWMAVGSGTYDLGIGIAPSREFTDLEWQRLAVQHFDSALVPSDHPLANRASIRLAELATEPIVAGFRLDSDHHRMCVKVAGRSVPHTPVVIVDTIADAFVQIANGAGWTPFVQSLDMWAPPGTAVVPVADLDATLVMCVIWKRGEMSAVVRTVRRALVQGAREAASDDVALRPGAGSAPVPPSGSDSGPSPNAAVPGALELRHLRYFLAVMNEHSIGQAAMRLSITQPTLSRQMHDLERAVGVELLERRTRGAVATAAGVEFATVARRILDRVDAIVPEVERATRGASGRCLVATVPPAIIEPLLASLLHRVATELREVRVGFVEIPTAEQPEALVSGQIDMALCHSFTPIVPYLDQLRGERLLDDTIRCALLAHDHPLAGREEIALAELGDIPFLFMPRSLHPAFYDQVLTLFAAQDFRPRIEQTYEGLETTWSLARRGEGWCIAFNRSLRDPPAGLAAVRVRELDLPWGIDMLVRRDESRAMVLRIATLVRSVAGAESARWRLESIASSRGVGYSGSELAARRRVRPRRARRGLDDIGPRTN